MIEERVGRGSAILIPGTHYDPGKFHLCIVLTDPPDADPKQVLYVPVITARKKYDTTCILDVGDHEFIVRKSCVHYARAGVRTVEHLLMCGTPKKPFDSSVLKRICDGVFTSPQCPARKELSDFSRL